MQIVDEYWALDYESWRRRRRQDLFNSIQITLAIDICFKMLKLNADDDDTLFVCEAIQFNEYYTVFPPYISIQMLCRWVCVCENELLLLTERYSDSQGFSKYVEASLRLFELNCVPFFGIDVNECARRSASDQIFHIYVGTSCACGSLTRFNVVIHSISIIN